MKQLPTAEELFKKYSNLCQFEERNNEYMMDIDDFKEAYMEGVKLHVEAALKEASEKATLLADGELTYFPRYIVVEGNHYSETEIDVNKDSILNSYSLDNIK